MICSALGLNDGSWPRIGQLHPWEHTLWPVPTFGSIALDGSIAWRVEYSDDLEHIRRREVPVEEAQQLPEDGAAGSVATQIILERLVVA